MKVTRSISKTIETEQFELGDVISFTLTTGEDVKAKAVLEIPEGMLFMTVDCLKDKRKMMVGESSLISYANSDLRKKLNSEILSIFPEENTARV